MGARDVASTSTLTLLSDAATGHGVAGAESVDWASDALQGEDDLCGLVCCVVVVAEGTHIRNGDSLTLNLGCLKEDGAVAKNLYNLLVIESTMSDR